jgi:hypothetical protein
MSLAAINYRETFFPVKDLTRIIGIPTYETLHTLHLELKTNSTSVHSNLGGGQFGHLGLVISPARYAMESNEAYVRPVHPGTLVIAAGDTRHAQDAHEREHKEQLRTFHETRNVEIALIQQIVSAIDGQYISPMKNRNTGQFTGTIYQILVYLQNTYGKISPGQLSAFEKEVSEYHYDPITPIDVVFNKVEDLIEYGELARNPYSELQTITKAYNIINATGTFKDGIKAWNRIVDPLHKTWIAFRIHFRTAHDELAETGDLTLRQSGYHQANMVDEIVTRLQSEQANQESTRIEETLQQLANAAITAPNPQADPMIPQLLAQMAQMQAMMTNMQTQTQTGNPNGRRNRPRTTLTGPRPGQPPHPLPEWINKYCWTHGLCSHHGRACRDKAPGHNDAATKTNKLGGSDWGCI